MTSRIMASIRSKNNRTEVALRRELHKRGLRFRVHARSVLGHPDICFPTERILVFIDGDYWHGRLLREKGEAAFYARMKTERRDFWLVKLRRNIDRDQYVTAVLREQGWVVLRFWESDITGEIASTANTIEDYVRGSRRRRPAAARASIRRTR